ncbi:FKBP-type peptidyl-prolyl cis-trans isomerase N-terminal domain-containing protein, partial [Psychrobacter sp. CAL346-MNA-CIBAN-0220]
MKKKAADNKTKGAAFLAENVKKDGVKATASGLQYKV